MSKRHDAIFDDVLAGIADDKPKADTKAGARFLKRSNALAEAGEREEKVLRWVDPAECVMWERHNRDYAALTEDNCRDLIDGLRAQGQQEFPAIVRNRSDAQLEVICGARRHFAVSWLRANNYPQFKYLVEVRDLTDEEAFRLADIENRDREDLSDYERAIDYAAALEHYYGGKQKEMAARLEVGEAWLSRYLQMAKLPAEIVDAFPSRGEIKELHARSLRPILKSHEDAVLAEAQSIAEQQAAARAGEGQFVPVPKVLSRLKGVAGEKPSKPETFVFRHGLGEVRMEKKGGQVRLSFSENIKRDDLKACLSDFQSWRLAKR